MQFSIFHVSTTRGLVHQLSTWCLQPQGLSKRLEIGPCLVGDIFQLVLEAFQGYLKALYIRAFFNSLEIAGTQRGQYGQRGEQLKHWRIRENSEEGGLLYGLSEDKRVSIGIRVDSCDFIMILLHLALSCLLRIFHMSSLCIFNLGN